MESLLAIVVGVLVAVSIFLLLRRHMLRLIFGLMLITNAVNLLLFTLGRVTRDQPPVVPPGATVPTPPYANPVPQALILTSIVISLGMLAFVLMLIYRTEKVFDTIDVDDLQAERGDDGAVAVREEQNPYGERHA